MENDGPLVLLFAEADDDGNLSRLSRELAGVGGELASASGCPLRAVMIGTGLAPGASELLSLGASVVYMADGPALADYNPDLYLDVMTRLLEGAGEVTLLTGHTRVAQDLLPRLSASLGAGLVTDCVGVKPPAAGGPTVFVKPVFGGNVTADLTVDTPIKLATVRARVGSAPEASGAAGETVELEPPAVASRVEVLDSVFERTGVDLDSARVIVAGGRGMGGADGFDKLSELASMLDGAVGASRPPCDSGWIAAANQVGITGMIVAPDIYIAVAISGSSQHLSGMSESGKIVAINQDPDAYIFKVADYGVAGDWKQVLPAFMEGLERALGA